MIAHCFQHVPFEDLGNIRPWMEKHGYSVRKTQFFNNQDFPQLGTVDFLIIMGGPMSVNDEAAYPWLRKEKEFIRRAVESGKKILGICLGAQLIASAMNAPVFPGEEKEIGWFPISSLARNNSATLALPESATVFHWHGETFSLPPGATHLARSRACENQAFQLGSSVVGLQFHPEVTMQSLKVLLENCRHELIDAAYIQTEEEIVSSLGRHEQTINGILDEVLSFIEKSGA